MDVVLDTNVFTEDFLMEGSKFRLLFDYLEKTGSRIMVPMIVYEEISAVYQRKVEGRIEAFRSAKGDLERALVATTLPDVTVTVEDEAKTYLKHFRAKLQITEDTIVPYKNGYLDEVVRRAIWRIKPCSDNGEEIRDALLWLMVLDIASTTDQRMLAFISHNTREFADKTGSLHADLAAEAEEASVSIRYFRNVGEFIQNHATTIEYVTPEWLDSAIDLGKVCDQVTDMLGEYDGGRFSRWSELVDSRGDILSARPIATHLGISSFYVYEMSDGSLYVEMNCVGEVEVELELEQEVEDDDWDVDFEYNPQTGDFEPTPVRVFSTRSEIIHDYLYPEVMVTVGLTVVGEEVKSYEIGDWEFA